MRPTPYTRLSPKPRDRVSAGFTLIELVVVILIIGILAAIAVPRYIDLTSEAKLARAQATAASLGAAAALDFAKAKVSGGVAKTKCSEIGLLVDPNVTSGLTEDGGASGVCTYTYETGVTATFVIPSQLP